jgi:hypothetical protein
MGILSNGQAAQKPLPAFRGAAGKTVDSSRESGGLLVGHFSNKLCNSMRENCLTFMPKSWFLFGYVVQPLGTATPFLGYHHKPTD